jgi:hypothetical protein
MAQREPLEELLHRSSKVAEALSNRDLKTLNLALEGIDEILDQVASEEVPPEQLEKLELLNEVNLELLVDWRQYFELLSTNLYGQSATYEPGIRVQQVSSLLEKRG